jgi:hypothetical protein
MLSLPNSRCSVDWKKCDWKISRPISGNMWIVSDVKWCCHDLICGDMCIGKIWIEDIKTNIRFFVDWHRWKRMMSWRNLSCYIDWNRWYGMLSWPNLKSYIHSKGCDRKIWRQLEFICDWNGCETMLSWHNLRWSLDWNGCEKNCSLPYKVLCGLEQMW